MATSSLEINENEYCIRFDRASFDLTTIQQLINCLQAKQRYLNKSLLNDEEDLRNRDASWEENFDRLSDK
ncbi:hypothetical protein [Pedobacter sp.]|uniref:hypothetical protein n=1 Tax=Pedobacter sp. TaxID=1411316 RepID=UPI003D7F5A61